MEWRTGDISGPVVASWQYQYDGGGRATRITNSFGEVTTFFYDGQGRLSRQVNQAAMLRTRYEYHPSRNRVSRIFTDRYTATGATESVQLDIRLTYDAVGNTTRITENGGVIRSFIYDDLDRLLAEEYSLGGVKTVDSWQYDIAGNITHHGAGQATTSSAPFATHDARNKQTSWVGQGTAPGYDADGNTDRLSYANGKNLTLAWTRLNLLANANIKQGTSPERIVTYESNPDDQSIMSKSEAGGGATFYVRGPGGQIIGEYVKEGSQFRVSKVYTHGVAGLISQRTMQTAQSQWFLFGPQAETRKLVSAAGATMNTYRYNAFGKVISQSEGVPNIFKQTGKYSCITDSDLDAVSCGVRWYSAQTMRWLSEDPAGFSGGVNLYGYVEGNPLRYIDITGRNPLPPTPGPGLRPPAPDYPPILMPQPEREETPCPERVSGCRMKNRRRWGSYPGDTCWFHGCGRCFNEKTPYSPRQQCCYNSNTGNVYKGPYKGTADFCRCEGKLGLYNAFPCLAHTAIDPGGISLNLPSEVEGYFYGDSSAD